MLAPGNSARELYELFAARGWPIEAKPFAVGFRVEHPQPLIDKIQYGLDQRPGTLPPADYKLADNPALGGAPRGVFSFCMCPGGVVVPTPTEAGDAVHQRDVQQRTAPRRCANAGLVVAVSPEDYAAEGFTGPAGRPRVAAQVGAGRLRAGRRRLPGPGPAAGGLGRQAGPAPRPGAPATGPA